jgi:hypothetical protein
MKDLEDHWLKQMRSEGLKRGERELGRTLEVCEFVTIVIEEIFNENFVTSSTGSNFQFSKSILLFLFFAEGIWGIFLATC